MFAMRLVRSLLRSWQLHSSPAPPPLQPASATPTDALHSLPASSTSPQTTLNGVSKGKAVHDAKPAAVPSTPVSAKGATATKGSTVPPPPPPPRAQQPAAKVNLEKPDIRVVSTAAELQAAISSGALDIEIRGHLDLRELNASKLESWHDAPEFYAKKRHLFHLAGTRSIWVCPARMRCLAAVPCYLASACVRV